MTSDLFGRIVQEESLRSAWGRVRSGGKAPGLDGMSVPQFEFHVERELDRLRLELRTGQYRPWPARRVRLPKAGGGERLIGIQAVRDRVVQRSVLNAIQPRVEPMLEDASYAFRPHRSVEMALASLANWHARGFNWVARGDVLLWFDSLDRTLLEQVLRQVVPEEDVRHLIGQWLTAGVVDEEAWTETGEGVGQGDVLSPLLCNLYLDRFDEAVLAGGKPLLRYADDFLVMGHSEAEAQQGLTRAAKALTELHLELNTEKSRVVSFMQGFTYLGAALVGSLILPTVRVEHPGKPPRFTFGYGAGEEPTFRRKRESDLEQAEAPPPSWREPPPTPSFARRGNKTFSPAASIATTQRALRDHMVALLRQEHAGQALSPMAAALLKAWEQAGRLPATPEPAPETWQSVYLI